MKTIHHIALLSLALAAFQVQAQGMNMPMGSKPAAKSSSAALPFVNAEVKRVDFSMGTVVLQHEDIPNLGMPGMTMEFGVASMKMLKGVKAGDKVRFQVHTVKSQAVVTKLEHRK